MFVLRDVAIGDIEGLHAVAQHLDTVNLPDDRAVLGQLIDLSERSFAGHLDLWKRQYLFGLFERDEGGRERLVGTSMIHAQHGTRRAPHIYFDVFTDERYSETLDRHIEHRVLRIGYNYHGPTEIGGLVLQPALRGHSAGLGRWLSYVRFLYIALHRSKFRDVVLSELLPPLESDGTSLLWESLGRHFTGMSYQEADRISQTNKEFIRALFPPEPIYACLLPAAAQALIGQVGPETKGVEKMLRRIGFAYAGRIDPFDGGPHFTARTDEISLVRATKRTRVVAVHALPPHAHAGLVCVERDRAPFFTATGAKFVMEGDFAALLPETCAALGVAAGDPVGVLPF